MVVAPGLLALLCGCSAAFSVAPPDASPDLVEAGELDPATDAGAAAPDVAAPLVEAAPHEEASTPPAADAGPAPISDASPPAADAAPDVAAPLDAADELAPPPVCVAASCPPCADSLTRCCSAERCGCALPPPTGLCLTSADAG